MFLAGPVWFNLIVTIRSGGDKVPSMRTAGRLAALAISLVLARPVAAEEVGIAIDVVPEAFVERDGTRMPLAPRQTIESGDVILTGETGNVQLTFRDKTRIVIGPATEFRIDEVTLNQDNRAERFVVTLLGGVFRFLTGDSAKSSYELRTPTATMGIRGTVFDMAVDSGRTTRFVGFDGQVRMCSRWRRCVQVVGGCSVVRTGSFGRILPPKDKTERDATLNTLFPFVRDQRRLGASFRAGTERCGDIDPNVFLRVAPAPSPLAEVVERPRNSDDRDDRNDRRGGSTGHGEDEKDAP